MPPAVAAIERITVRDRSSRRRSQGERDSGEVGWGGVGWDRTKMKSRARKGERQLAVAVPRGLVFVSVPCCLLLSDYHPLLYFHNMVQVCLEIISPTTLQ